ncbi:DUF998 domain-containing protein [Kineococcus sp. TBRC 1896]|uniref:DUF998 domain-containing protein n=1 Tax=Kineococcus mangrovi TaxID=1660183 RepID=A0ABV4I3K5_9ACTN
MRLRLGLLLWVVQVLYLAVELIAVAAVQAPYSLVDNTISDLGAVGCATVAYPTGPVPVCSPGHVAVNVSFVVFGAAMALGAVLLRPFLFTGRAGWVTTAVWVVAGVAQVGSGLVPVDADLEGHALVSAPGIVATGLASVLMGWRAGTLRRWPRWRAVVLVVGAGSLVCGAFFVVRLDTSWGGLLERAALWPSCVLLTLVAHLLGAASAQEARSVRGRTSPAH